jgi:hypothetical protein
MSNDTVSNIDSDEEQNIKDIIESEPMYYVLSQFFESANSNKNVATILDNILTELKDLRIAIQNQDKSSTVTVPS